MTPRCFLIGHTGPILSLAFVHLTTDNFDLIVSSSDNGYEKYFTLQACNSVKFGLSMLYFNFYRSELCNWDAIDGRCLETTKCINPHTKMQVCS